MSLITRCPACATMFRIVSDQLKVSDGWVRCGQCADVFNAQLHLQSSTDRLPDPVSQPETAVMEPSAFQTLDGQKTTSAVEESVSDPYASGVVTGLDSNIVPVAVVPGNLSDEGQSLADVPNQITAADVEDTTEAVVENVSFVRDARRQTFWRKPLARLGLAFFALSLVCLFTVQLALKHYNTVLTFEPRLKPWLQQLCHRIACDSGLSRQIESIVIDSSSFSKANAVDGFQLSFTLKNTANVEVTMPFLEVTLTDTQDRAVIRRVLSPAQFGAGSKLLAAESEFGNALTLQIQSEVPFERIAGYRLLAFYP